MRPLQSFLCLIALLGFCHSVDAGIRVEKVLTGLDSYVRADRWVPIVFELRSTGSNFQGAIEVVRGETIFRKSVDLSMGALKRTEMLIYQSPMYENMRYRIVDDKGRVIGEEKIEPRLLNYQDNLVVVISDTDYNHQFVNGVQNPWGGKTFVAYLKAADGYSDPLAYSSADAVALGNFSFNEISPAQRQAILLYAATGGAIICSSATSISILKEPSIRNVLPEISTELTHTSHGEFLVSRWTANNTTPFPIFEMPIQQVHPRQADHVLVALNPDLSLVTASPFYKGGVLYFAFDYTRVPEEIRTIFAGYWSDLVHPSSGSPPVFGRPFRKRLEDNPRAQKFLYEIKGLKLPDVKWFALFFFIYLMMIGPLQYLILTRLKKNAMLWTTFPIIILLFTATSIGYSKWRRSSTDNIRHVQVIEVFPHLNAQVRYQGFGTAVSSSGNFSFQALPETSYMTKSARQNFSSLPEPYVFSENLPHTIMGEQIKTWAYRTYDAVSAEQALQAPVQIQARIDGTVLKGQITNATNSAIEKAFFLYDRRNTALLGDIGPGANRTFSLELNNSSPPPFAENHLRDLLNLSSLTLGGPHFFFGEISTEPGEIVINGKPHKTECLQYVAVYINLHQQGPMNAWLPEYAMPYR